MLKITVYQRHDSIRVVADAHAAHVDSKSYRVAVYPSAKLAFAAESDPRVRAAILLIAPDAADDTPAGGLPPIRKVPLSEAVFGPTRKLPYRDLADVPETDDNSDADDGPFFQVGGIARDLSGRDLQTCPGTLQWPRWNGSAYVCPDCGQTFTRGELRGRDDHMPPHVADFARGPIVPEGFETCLTLPAIPTDGIEVAEVSDLRARVDFLREFRTRRDATLSAFLRRQAE